jgi:predicted metal-binding membrane protein
MKPASGGASMTNMTNGEPNRACRGYKRSLEIPQAVVSGRTSSLAFLGFSALLFAVCTTVTIAWCASMSAMGGMPMPGGWTMSMAWMRMPGKTWPEMMASFLTMWDVMMMAMMLPSLIAMLWRYRHAAARSGKIRLNRLSVSVAAGYFFVWTVVGIVIFPFGTALATMAMRQPALAHAVPVTIGAVVLIAGSFQFTGWKMHHLTCCREMPDVSVLPAGPFTAWRYGVRLGFHCCRCCANLMIILFVIGIMDLRVMAVITAAITIERLAPASERVVWAIGFIAVGAGLFLITSSLGIG